MNMGVTTARTYPERLLVWEPILLWAWPSRAASLPPSWRPLGPAIKHLLPFVWSGRHEWHKPLLDRVPGFLSLPQKVLLSWRALRYHCSLDKLGRKTWCRSLTGQFIWDLQPQLERGYLLTSFQGGFLSVAIYVPLGQWAATSFTQTDGSDASRPIGSKPESMASSPPEKSHIWRPKFISRVARSSI